jgi:hypothetical protein
VLPVHEPVVDVLTQRVADGPVVAALRQRVEWAQERRHDVR